MLKLTICCANIGIDVMHHLHSTSNFFLVMLYTLFELLNRTKTKMWRSTWTCLHPGWNLFTFHSEVGFFVLCIYTATRLTVVLTHKWICFELFKYSFFVVMMMVMMMKMVILFFSKHPTCTKLKLEHTPVEKGWGSYRKRWRHYTNVA